MGCLLVSVNKRKKGHQYITQQMSKFSARHKQTILMILSEPPVQYEWSISRWKIRLLGRKNHVWYSTYLYFLVGTPLEWRQALGKNPWLSKRIIVHKQHKKARLKWVEHRKEKVRTEIQFLILTNVTVLF